MNPALGSLGAWLPRSTPLGELADLAPELEELGYDAIWVSGGREPGIFDAVDILITSTKRSAVATGIVNIWAETPETVSAAWHRIESAHPGRLFVGVGVSHAPLIEGLGLGPYTQPLQRTRAFLDELGRLPVPVPPDRMLLGALGPRMLALARERTLGSHPYLVTVDNTATARSELGNAFLAPEVGVVLEPDRDKALAAARAALSRYFALPNYTRNWGRAGFGPDDLRDGGSERLIDAVVAMGDVDAVARRIQEYRDAGADHVALQVLTPSRPIDTFRALNALR